MNQAWYPPEIIDWGDGLNPLARPAFKEQVNPAVSRALQRPTLVELRNTPGLRLAIHAAPDASVSLPPAATVDAILSIPPDSWIIGIGASSKEAEGFLAQVTAPSGGALFSQPTHSANLNAKPHYLQRPQPSLGGILKLRLINLSLSANFAQLAVWVIQPLEPYSYQ
jgi:hypothetical protein